MFAVKGGTTINLFHRDMPRLSLDINFAYLPLAKRETSLKDIDDTDDCIVAEATKRNPRVVVGQANGGSLTHLVALS